ncbi:hypothetical protein [Streptomyces atratus]|uniref:hypothetical protein n=1 Tax=Streptomyces atratus TaxID=1893 RepID=UPI0016708CE4|nr:hypothetical protein [Streptomyces atratus]
MSASLLPQHRILDAEQAERRFAVSADVGYPYRDFAREQEIRLYATGLTVDGDLVSRPPGIDWNPCNVIVAGDLTVSGDLSWSSYGGGCFLLVTGDLRARNIFVAGEPNVVVRGDLTVSNGVFGHDNYGILVVCGRTTARIVINTSGFNMVFAEDPQAFVMGHPNHQNVASDIDDELELEDVLATDLLDHGVANVPAIRAALVAGRSILRPGISSDAS